MLLATGALFMLSACGDDIQEKPKETFNNPVNTYLDSRVDAMQNAKSVVEETNKRTKAQDEAMKALVK